MKTTRHENFRVVIEPRGLGDFGSVRLPDHWGCLDEAHMHRQYRERCEEIAADVKRHVDNAGIVHIDFDTVATCGHCGAPWTESGDYNGGCCEADQKAQDEREEGK